MVTGRLALVLEIHSNAFMLPALFCPFKLFKFCLENQLKWYKGEGFCSSQFYKFHL